MRPDESVFAVAEERKNLLYSLYIYASKRSLGHFKSWIASNPEKTIATLSRCQLQSVLQHLGHPHVIQEPAFSLFPEYQLVRHAYGDYCAARTGVHLINHIDEGVFVLSNIKASQLAVRAYCLHPLLQSDEDCVKFFEHLGDAARSASGSGSNQSSSSSPAEPTAAEGSSREQSERRDEGGGEDQASASYLVSQVDPRVLMLAVEYRSTANAYLSHNHGGAEAIKLSPLKDVNDMLIADKIQNRKDFELYHEGSHPKSDRLKEYFRQWLAALSIDEEVYARLKDEMLGRVYGTAKVNWPRAAVKRRGEEV